MRSITKNQRADRGVSPSIDGRPGDLHDGLAAAWAADHARSELGKDPRPRDRLGRRWIPNFAFRVGLFRERRLGPPLRGGFERMESRERRRQLLAGPGSS